ncbi:MAG TPA: heparan-alpha-glucosaminide N-acetyltransferase domain-containing protein [Pyrinomonadaceae bacterium]|jgi:uncharacterized membrane protein|nr:heparan-alpha-glucosaminide N-acetyltransferase domain-containing protein [Pyrinomonadaceae bacterium]
MSQATTTTGVDVSTLPGEFPEVMPATEGGTNLLGERLGARARLQSVDLLRGVVMVIMALDHARDFFHRDALLFDPTDLSKTNAALFITRWVTHFCAPVFVFLAGTGAFLSTSRGKTKGELARFLLTRGLWLILLEMTVVRSGWFFNFDLSLLFGQVIWALGWSMIALAGLIYLPVWAIAAFGLVMIAAHNLLDPVTSKSLGPLGWLWTVLHQGGPIFPRPGMVFFVAYPLVPWVGVMAAGYAFGRVLLLEPARRRRLLLWLGSGAVALFVVLRAVNVYGDPAPWKTQDNWAFTFFSFINTQKYPPSLLYLLMTLGPALVFLALFDRSASGKLARPFVVFGRVPLFYYLLHLPLIHGAACLFALAKYGRAGWLFQNWPPPGSPPTYPTDYGYPLWVVYAVWLGAVLALYPLCLWFSRLKQRRRDAWLSYL